MKAASIEKSLMDYVGGSFATISDIARWAGKSRVYVKDKLLADVESISTGTQTLYYIEDVAQAISEKAKVQKVQ